MAESTTALRGNIMGRIRIKNSGLKFVGTLTLWSLLSIAVLFFLVTVVAKMSFSFFEANGMMKEAFVRSALADQLFLAVDPSFFALLLVGLLAVAVVAYLFAHSQAGYVQRLNACLHAYVDTWSVPKVEQLGPLAIHVADFLEVVDLRVKKESNDRIEAALQKALRNWPTQPSVSLQDMFQFVIVAVVLSVFFSGCCAVFFYQIANQLVELGSTIKFTSPKGPLFLQEQYELVSLLLWVVILVTSVTFVSTGYRLGRLLAESNYAILRDMKRFMQGDKDQRIFLRATDPVCEYVPKMNDALDRIAKKI